MPSKGKYVGGHPEGKEPSRYFYTEGCRCSGCTKTAAEYTAKLRARVREPLVHGTSSSYTNYGCRCDECRSAYRNNRKRYRSSNESEIAKAFRKESKT